jgi:carboxypeptidase family protein
MKQLVILLVAAGSLLVHAQVVQAQVAQAQTAPPSTGEIKGTVTDQNGSPVSGATIYAVPQGLVFDDITPRSVRTDSNGRFDFHGGLQLVAYKIYSQKEADSYPNPLDQFYAAANDQAPMVDLTPNQPSASVTVKLGDKAAVIVGRVIDRDTGAVLTARICFLDTLGKSHLADSATADGTFRALLPPDKDLTLLVVSDSSHHLLHTRLPAPLRLEPGQYVYMDIPVSQ